MRTSLRYFLTILVPSYKKRDIRRKVTPRATRMIKGMTWLLYEA